LANVVGDIEVDDDEFGDLHGFLTAVIGFVRMMRNPLAIQGGAKTYAPMMHRNDFATMFGLLSDTLKDAFRENPQPFIDAIIAGVVADIDEDDPLEDYDPAAHRDEYIFRRFVLETGDQRRFEENLELPNYVGGRAVGYYALPPSFTIQRWVTAWMNGDDPQDLLTTAHFEFAAHNEIEEDPDLDDNMQAVRDNIDPRVRDRVDWGRSRFENGRAYLAFNYQALTDQQKEILTDYVRGLGGLGENTDLDDNSLLLYENRNITPEYLDHLGEALNPEGGGKLDMESAKNTVLDYFVAMKELFG
jgi:hypothetical protein